MNYDLVIWDFDGTIADSLPRAAEIYNDLATSLGLLRISDSQAVREMTFRQFLRAHRIPLHKLPLLTARFLSAQKRRSEPLDVFPGIANAVHELRNSGLRMGVVSSNDPNTIADCLRQNGLADCFEFSIGCSRMFGKHRAIRNVVRSADVTDNRTLYIGDEARDIEAARKVGINAAAVTWGFNSASVLEQFSPAHVINEPHELVEVCGVKTANRDR